jgi:hypothetical protein
MAGIIQAESTVGKETRIDEVSGNLTYLGVARMDSDPSLGVWQIRRILKTGTETVIEWADGNDYFDNVWDNRASLSYS